MLAKKALNTDIRPLTAKDSISEALRRMSKYEVNVLPVVDSTTEKLIGQVHYNTLEKVGDSKKPISDINLEEGIKIYVNQHIFEAARLMLQYEMRILPVVDEEYTFKGIIRKQTVLENLTGMLNLEVYGSVITIELDQRDFTLSEIVHLIETEEAKILGITVETPTSENEAFEVSIKINFTDATRVASALRRYGYNVIAENRNEVYGLDLESRADELLKYIDM